MQMLSHEAHGVALDDFQGRLYGVESFDQRVASNAILAHGSVHDLPTFVAARQRRWCESWHDTLPNVDKQDVERLAFASCFLSIIAWIDIKDR
jgi:hypothetical protein